MNAKIVYLDTVAIKVLMAKKQVNQLELCRIIDFNSGNFSTMMKRGTARPRTAKLIADALGATVDEIVRKDQGG